MTLAVYTNDFAKDVQIIEELRYYLYQQNNYIDFFICCNILNAVGANHYGCLSPFYLEFLDGDILFLNIQDYLEFKDKIIGSPLVYIDTINAISSMDKNMFKKCKFVTKQQDNSFIVIDNHAL